MDENQQYNITTWLTRLVNCKIPFVNNSLIAPFEVACIYNYNINEEIYCPFLNQVNDNGQITMMTFINPDIVDTCDFAYTEPVHWLKKLYNIELQNLEDYEKFQSNSIINYITVFMNKMVCYSNEYVLYHDRISKEGPNQIVDEITCIIDYTCQMIEETGITNLTNQLSISIKIVESFYEYFDIPIQQELIFMACDKIRHMREEDNLELDLEIWGDIL